jgi:thiamine biosynthesis lipoprotein
MNIIHRSVICIFIVLLLVPNCLACSYDTTPQPNPAQSVDIVMGTVMNQTIYGESATQAIAQVKDMVLYLETNCLSNRLESAEVYRINERETDEPISLSADLAKVLKDAARVWEASDGAFDPTLGALTELWNIDAYANASNTNASHINNANDNESNVNAMNANESNANDMNANDANANAMNTNVSNTIYYEIPTQEAIREALTHTGYELVQSRETQWTFPTGLTLDLGAIGKGVACDYALQYLSDMEGIDAAVVNIGGSALLYGEKPDQTDWVIGIVHPRDTENFLGWLHLQGQWCVSTSGDYQRFVEVDGVRYHHILDPATGYPADSGVLSVTILSKSGALSDALSTACFVLGVEKGLALAQELGAHALFVDQDLNLYMTLGMEQYISINS